MQLPLARAFSLLNVLTLNHLQHVGGPTEYDLFAVVVSCSGVIRSSFFNVFAPSET